MSKLQFKKEGFFKDDDLKEMEHFYLDLRDDYEEEVEDIPDDI